MSLPTSISGRHVDARESNEERGLLAEAVDRRQKAMNYDLNPKAHPRKYWPYRVFKMPLRQYVSCGSKSNHKSMEITLLLRSHKKVKTWSEGVGTLNRVDYVLNMLGSFPSTAAWMRQRGGRLRITH
ncbi:hypothetical protein HETIRDRAFT_173693 [Heterobasidion irregulare TC 32-1]|uniref:Uncharacterized protein n=1 Tax=Heterobasidion irregulare (strain TC 32-1) TaxID=747525 RepID=W4K4F2_HETIT|nr:uncharacterized protein HETIRDRAFT_173693 [Heterobasidion irregulare TC 32-1]ETW80225.1 hypothetical protein HETIRDRAFT_173693 [Heterobasidion irregulare TC 32-1]